MTKLKYLSIFLLPATVLVSLCTEGILNFLPLIVFFVLLPVVEQFLPLQEKNMSPEEAKTAENDFYYEWLLYLMMPVQWGFLVYFLFTIGEAPNNHVLIGRITAMGIMCAVIGINLGHELGHHDNKISRFIGEILLLSSLQNHFLPYHTRGHHTNVGTHQDPATARKNETMYVFWFRSQIGSYFEAWKIEMQKCRIQQRPPLHYSNKMIQYTIIHVLMLFSIFYFFGSLVLLYFIIAAIIGIVQLESVNYIEHYGLYRKKNKNGVYERVQRHHSWNSNHYLGRLVLFELSRHSDHHYKANRPYQILESHKESPVMPAGYPAMMMLALFPPLFFRIMNPLVSKAMSRQ